MGNSSAGKSSLAKRLVEEFNLTHLDLDTLAWEDNLNPRRRSLDDSMKKIREFIGLNKNWVMEGCYGDLIEKILDISNVLIFLNPDIETCLNNAKNRGWESHKYDSLEAQNANLAMLEEWIKDYFVRKDEFSFTTHQELYRSFSGRKIEFNYNWNEELINLIHQIHRENKSP